MARYNSRTWTNSGETQCLPASRYCEGTEGPKDVEAAPVSAPQPNGAGGDPVTASTRQASASRQVFSCRAAVGTLPQRKIEKSRRSRTDHIRPFGHHSWCCVVIFTDPTARNEHGRPCCRAAGLPWKVLYVSVCVLSTHPTKDECTVGGT